MENSYYAIVSGLQKIRKSKLCKAMRAGLFFAMICITQALASDSYAQDTRLSLDIENRPIQEILEIIEEQTEFRFMYDATIVDLHQKKSIKCKNQSVAKILDDLFKDSGISYKIEDRQIALSRSGIRSNSKQTMQQQLTVTGKVTDQDGQPLPGTTVMIKGTTQGTITDADGNYSLSDVPADATLVFSFVGMETREIKVENRSKIDVTLQEEAIALQEVVAVGYGTMRKSDLTAAISTVKADDLVLSGGVASVGHALAGRASGLYVRQNSAQPGGGLDILIRGAGSINANNTPLYIVDGFPIAQLDQLSVGDRRMDPGTQGILNFLNPSDIESIEVLKDASATAIYGSRAANGVVLITTKRGKEGKPIVSYSGSYSLQEYTDNYDLLSLKEWMIEKNHSTWEQWVYDNRVTPWGPRSLEEAIKSPVNGLKYIIPYSEEEILAAGEGTKWLDLITRNGQIDEHNLSLQGGTQYTKYMLSFNYYDHKGIVKNSGMTRYTFRTNFDQNISNNLKVGMNLVLTRINNDNTQLGEEQYENSGIIRAAIQMGPHIKAYDPETGTYPLNPLLGTQPNPYSLLNNLDHGKMDRLLGNVFIECIPIKGLLFRLNGGIDRAARSRKTYQPKTTLYGSNLGGVGRISTADNNQYLLDFTANYLQNFNNVHNVNLMAGVSFEKFNDESAFVGNNNFLTDAFIYNNLGAGAGTKIVGSGLSENKMMSYFFRANYVYGDRYLLTATLRADGASIFSKNNKWGSFPSFAAGWRISEENFMESASSWLDNLKLRISWGQTGNAEIGTNAFASYYAQEAYNREDKSKQIGVFLGRLENPALKWETTTEYNIGVDFGLFGSRVVGSFEYYHKVISDLLNYKPLNIYHEIPQIMANIGKTQSTGFEATINTHNIITKNFSWSTDFVFTKYKDKWKERTSDWKPAVYEVYDAPIRPIYSRIADHIMQIGEETPQAQPLLVPGQIVIKDINGYVRDQNGDPMVDEKGRFLLLNEPDGIIDDADTRLIGSYDPGWLGGMTNTFKYKDFDFSFHFNGMFDRIMVNPTFMEYGVSADGIARYDYNALRSVKERWTWDNPSTTHPSSFYGWDHNYTAGDFFFEDAWFIRLQNISLGYTLPEKVSKNLKSISKARIYFNVNNVFLITPYSGLDPETDSYTASYPNSRTFNFGINIQF